MNRLWFKPSKIHIALEKCIIFLHKYFNVSRGAREEKNMNAIFKISSHGNILFFLQFRKIEISITVIFYHSISCPWCDFILDVRKLSKFDKLSKQDTTARCTQTIPSRWTNRMPRCWCKRKSLATGNRIVVAREWNVIFSFSRPPLRVFNKLIVRYYSIRLECSIYFDD